MENKLLNQNHNIQKQLAKSTNDTQQKLKQQYDDLKFEFHSLTRTYHALQDLKYDNKIKGLEIKILEIEQEINQTQKDIEKCFFVYLMYDPSDQQI